GQGGRSADTAGGGGGPPPPAGPGAPRGCRGALAATFAGVRGTPRPGGGGLGPARGGGVSGRGRGDGTGAGYPQRGGGGGAPGFKSPQPPRLGENRELREGHLPASLIVGRRHARRQPVVHGDQIGTTVRVSERDGNRHLAAQRRIIGFKFVHFDNLFVRHELH